MLKSFNKNSSGEITTAVALFVIITSLIGIVAGYTAIQSPGTFNTKSKAATCAEVTSIDYNPKPLGNGTDFRCNVNITSASVASSQYSMTCGWSKNGGWPQNGDRWQNATCNGTNCHFDIRMDPSLDPNAAYELVGYDFKSECGPTATGGKRVAMTTTTSGGSSSGSTTVAGGNCFTNLIVSPSQVSPGQSFTCSYSVDTTKVNPNTLNCGVQKNNTFVDGVNCQGGTTGANASFTCNSPATAGEYDIVGFSWEGTSGCTQGDIRAKLTVGSAQTSPQATQAPAPTPTTGATTQPSPTSTPTPTTPPNADCGYYNLPCCPVPKVVNRNGTCSLSTLTCNSISYTCVAKPTSTSVPTHTLTPTTKSASPLKPPPFNFPNPASWFSPPTSTLNPTPQTQGEQPLQEDTAKAKIAVKVRVINSNNLPIETIGLWKYKKENNPNEQPFIQVYKADLNLQEFIVDNLEKGETYYFKAFTNAGGAVYISSERSIIAGQTEIITLDLPLGKTGLIKAVADVQKVTQEGLNKIQNVLLKIPVIGGAAYWLFGNTFGTI